MNKRFSLVISVILIAVAGCTTKEVIPTNQEPTSMMGKKSMETQPDFYLKGMKINFSTYTITSTTSLVAGYEPNTVLIFETDEEFVSWAKEKQDRNALLKAHDDMDRLRQYGAQHGLIDNEEATQAYMQSMRATQRVSLVSILYRDYDFSGDTYTIPGVPWPSLGSFNDEASSVEDILSLTVLCSRTWFRGSKFYLASVPFRRIPDLSEYGFDDNTRSVFF